MANYTVTQVDRRSSNAKPNGKWRKVIISDEHDPLAAAICVNTFADRVDIAISRLDLDLLFNVVFRELVKVFADLEIPAKEQLALTYLAERPDGGKWQFRPDKLGTVEADRSAFVQGYLGCVYERTLKDVSGRWFTLAECSPTIALARVGIDKERHLVLVGARLADMGNDVHILYRAYLEMIEGFQALGIMSEEWANYRIYHGDLLHTPTGTVTIAAVSG